MHSFKTEQNSSQIQPQQAIVLLSDQTSNTNQFQQFNQLKATIYSPKISILIAIIAFCIFTIPFFSLDTQQKPKDKNTILTSTFSQQAKISQFPTQQKPLQKFNVNKIQAPIIPARSIQKQTNPQLETPIKKSAGQIALEEKQKKQAITNEILSHELIKFYKSKGNITIGDIGSGTCFHGLKLINSGFSVEGYDLIARNREFKPYEKVINILQVQSFGKKYDWVQSLQMQKFLPINPKGKYVDQQNLITNLYKHSKNGIILRWRTFLDWKIEQISQFLQQYGFIYSVQITKALKGKLLAIQNDQLAVFQKIAVPPNPFLSPQKLSLGIFTIFIMNENIPFLREWLIYNIKLGVDKFYLYDNTGSIGRNGATANVNKYGFQFRRIINSSDEELAKQWNSILRQYGNYITYEKWQPRNQKNQIIYNHREGVKHYLTHHGSQVNFTAFIDIDQFLFSQNGENIKQYIFNKRKQGITKLILKQKKFKDRFCSPTNKVTDITQYYNFDTQHWDPKLIIQTNVTIEGIMHWLKIKQGLSFQPNMNQLRFNHYNTNTGAWIRFRKFLKLNPQQLELVKSQILKQRYYDNGMSKYSQMIQNLCDNKCSDKNIKIKFEKIEEFQALCNFQYQTN